MQKIEYLMIYLYTDDQMIRLQSMDTKYTLIGKERDIISCKNQENFSPIIPPEIDEELHRLILRCLKSGIEYERVHHSENKIYTINRLNYLLHEMIISHTTYTALISTTSKECPGDSSTGVISMNDLYIPQNDAPFHMNAEYDRYTELVEMAKEYILKW